MRRPAPPTTPAAVIEIFLNAYRHGAFPMAELPGTPPADGTIPTAQAIHWYAPDPRAVLELNEGGLHVPSGLRRRLKKQPFVLTSDRCFERVIRACAMPTERRGALWLDETLIRCYTLLHEHGHAHSVEAWGSHGTLSASEGCSTSRTMPIETPLAGAQGAVRPADARLLGGIYGVSIGAAFFAESMFSDLEHGGSGASGACLVALWEHLRSCGYTLMDLQLANDHTRRFGLVEIPLSVYLERLKKATDEPDKWRPLNASAG